MTQTIAIYKKELFGFIKAPAFYMVAFLCSAVFTWMYPVLLQMFGQVVQMGMFQQQMQGSPELNIHYGVFLKHLSYFNLVMILIVPALTMRLFAEEKKMRTFDLLLTSPLTSVQIVAGKYLAALTAVFLLLCLALLYPVATSLLTTFDWLPLFIASFGIFLVGAVYTAMSLFCSSLTQSLIVSYVMAVILNIFIWFVGIMAEVVDSAWARKIFEHISLTQHLGSLVEGTIRTNGMIFFASLIFLFCFLTERVVESSRWR